jgi:hypothetical protein
VAFSYNTIQSETLTIASGAITPTGSYHHLATEGGAASDDLDTINTSTLGNGSIFFARVTSAANDVIVRHAVGNIHCYGDIDLKIYSSGPTIMFFESGTNYWSAVPISGAQYGLQLSPWGVTTLSAGTAEIVNSYHVLDTEGSAATDDLDTINSSFSTGAVLLLSCNTYARKIVIKHGTGNIYTYTSADLVLNSSGNIAVLIKRGTYWNCVASSILDISYAALNAITVSATAVVASTVSATTVSATAVVASTVSASNVYATEILNADDAVITSASITYLSNELFEIPTGTSTLVISSGAITPTSSSHIIDTEGGASTDDLVYIPTDVLQDGSVLILKTLSPLRKVTIKNTGDNILTFSGDDVTLGNTNVVAVFILNFNKWILIAAGGPYSSLSITGMLSANTVSAAAIAASTVSATTVSATVIAASTVSSARVVASTVSSARVVASTVSATTMNASRVNATTVSATGMIYTTLTVSLGAADSGGAGYRVMRVSN